MQRQRPRETHTMPWYLREFVNRKLLLPVIADQNDSAAGAGRRLAGKQRRVDWRLRRRGQSTIVPMFLR